MTNFPLVGSMAIGLILLLIAFVIFTVVSFCKVYKKANQPWWSALIPIYSTYILLKIIRKPLWIVWVVLGLVVISFFSLPKVIEGVIQVINLGMWWWMSYHLAKVFGKGVPFTIGLVILPFIFYPILAFGKAEYIGDNSTPTPTPMPVTPASQV